jgi:hypothetical protein
MLPGTNKLRVEIAVPPGPGVIGFWLNDPPIPVGPDIARATGDAKLLREVTVIPTLPDEPCAKTMVEALSAIEKSPEYSMKAQEFAWHVPSA